LITKSPPPKLQEPKKWSDEFNDFLSQCLKKNPDERPTAKELLEHRFVKKAKTKKLLIDLIDKTKLIFQEAGGREKFYENEKNKKKEKEEKDKKKDSDEDDDTESENEYSTIVKKKKNKDSEDDESESDNSSSETLIRKKTSSTIKKSKQVDDDDDDDDDSDSRTMVRKNVTIKKEETDEDDDESDSATMVLKKNLTLKDDVDDMTTLNNFYKNLSVNEIKSQLQGLDKSMELELQEVKNKYSKRKLALEKALKNKN
jgi:serine/threonine protein kinase